MRTFKIGKTFYALATVKGISGGFIGKGATLYESIKNCLAFIQSHLNK